MSFPPDWCDLSQLKHYYDLLASGVIATPAKPKPPRFENGTVVVPTGFTVLENEHGFGEYVDSGRFQIYILTEECLLLVLETKDKSIRVMSLESGQIGRMSEDAVVEYR